MYLCMYMCIYAYKCIKGTKKHTLPSLLMSYVWKEDLKELQLLIQLTEFLPVYLMYYFHYFK